MKPEIREKLEKERKKVKSILAKSGSIQFRCNEDLILRLNEMAHKKNLPVTKMVRDWVAEKLEREESGNPQTEVTEFEYAVFTVWKKAVINAINTANPSSNKEALILDFLFPHLGSEIKKEIEGMRSDPRQTT